MTITIEGKKVNINPFCTSERCSPGRGKNPEGPGKQVKKSLNRVKNDICLDCGHYVVWVPEQKTNNKCIYKSKQEHTMWRFV